MNNALILVDLQNDFMLGGALAVAEGDQLPAMANAIMSRYDLVVATQDWHPANHGSFAVNNPGAQVFELGTLNGLDQVMWPEHCVQDTRGAAFHDELNLDGIDRVFPKGCNPAVDSYSGFFDNNKADATGLGDYLQEQNITVADVMGLATDYCVKFTALDALELGFTTRLLVPACRAVGMNPTDEADALLEMRAKGVELVNDIMEPVRQ